MASSPSAYRAYSLVQPAIIVHEIDDAVDRLHALLGAVPSTKTNRPDFVNAVYTFANTTHLEVLDGMYDGHTRSRFLQRFGPGLYMLCVDLAPVSRKEVEAELARLGKRVVQEDHDRGNIVSEWHIHPHDTANLLVLIAIKADLRNNNDWAGELSTAFVPGNTRVVDEVRGVLARTADPGAEAEVFAGVGMQMQAVGNTGARAWTGPTGTCFELWPAGAWPGADVIGHRDFALCLTARDPAAAIARFERYGLKGEHGLANGRWVSEIDPVLGVRLAVAAASRG
jgi:hypothetical protein